MDANAEQRFGSYVFVGFAIGGITGMVLKAGTGNTFSGFWIGALVGIFLGWLIGTAIHMNESKQKKHQ